MKLAVLFFLLVIAGTLQAAIAHAFQGSFAMFWIGLMCAHLNTISFIFRILKVREERASRLTFAFIPKAAGRTPGS